MTDSARSLELFLEAFNARDIAEPLPSFDDSTPREAIQAAIASSRFDVAGIRSRGFVTAWVTLDDLRGPGGQPRPIEDGSRIDDSAPLHEVIKSLSEAEPLFMRTLGQVTGVIRRRDIQKPAARMWLFGLITVMEQRVTGVIREQFPDAGWQRFLSPGRLQKAKDLQAARARHRENRDLLDCLQLADKGTIIARDGELRRLSRFESRRGVEEFVSGLESLRNQLAHAQELSADWEIIEDLARNLRRVVTGAAESTWENIP